MKDIQKDDIQKALERGFEKFVKDCINDLKKLENETKRTI